MATTGDFFTVDLHDVHLNWGTVSRDGSRNRHPDEVYIPITMDTAMRLNLLNNCTEFNVHGQDFTVKATGTQGTNGIYGKNLTSANGLRHLGRYLKGHLNAIPGNTVRVEWLSDTEVEITLV
ncbi:hypothetical protein [Clostridium sp. Ade.TY]|uniref:hypothetical protein n=1 Tax=Clostridium sp. Ade.TY TaxID=1391647 RepID=UPI000428252F|nr:hypothetical protein [Clostridium sp. Ade.TY]